MPTILTRANPGAAALGRSTAGPVFGISARDPTTFAGAATLLAVVALAAALVPARRRDGRPDARVCERTESGSAQHATLAAICAALGEVEPKGAVYSARLLTDTLTALT